ncbi:hypothetical protein [Magnetospirillum sp. 15-1]|uniref:hypothetical protein n=1 Tax=Magnetospirillum sp. 15-1 TaxID=1979370 RepID=UPI0011438814|nr:hypothetical protein [Magnetospirillum sp. 15-1]
MRFHDLDPISPKDAVSVPPPSVTDTILELRQAVMALRSAFKTIERLLRYESVIVQNDTERMSI